MKQFPCLWNTAELLPLDPAFCRAAAKDWPLCLGAFKGSDMSSQCWAKGFLELQVCFKQQQNRYVCLWPRGSFLSAVEKDRRVLICSLAFCLLWWYWQQSGTTGCYFEEDSYPRQNSLHAYGVSLKKRSTSFSGTEVCCLLSNLSGIKTTQFVLCCWKDLKRCQVSLTICVIRANYLTVLSDAPSSPSH